MGRGSVCDPFDAAEIVERITEGETTAADAWRAYAATAVRPRALRRGVEPREDKREPCDRRSAMKSESVRERVRSS